MKVDQITIPERDSFKIFPIWHAAAILDLTLPEIAQFDKLILKTLLQNQR